MPNNVPQLSAEDKSRNLWIGLGEVYPGWTIGWDVNHSQRCTIQEALDV